MLTSLGCRVCRWQVTQNARGFFGTDCRGKSCCSDGAVELPAVERSLMVDELWEDADDAKLLRKHARAYPWSAAVPPETPHLHALHCRLLRHGEVDPGERQVRVQV